MKPADEAKPQAESEPEANQIEPKDYEVSARDMVLFVDGKEVVWK